MQIGELARATGKSVAALRYYEQIGLIYSSQRTAAGYRQYAPTTVERVRFIVRAQERGFSLQEIKTVLALSERGQTPCPTVAKAARQKVRKLDQQIVQLKQRRSLLVEAIRLWDAGSLEAAAFCPLLNVSQSNEKEVIKMKKTVEVFTASCPLCDEAVKLVKAVACPNCEVKVYDLREGCASDECHELAQRYGVKTVPAVVVDGQLAECCRSGGVTESGLRAAGVGRRASGVGDA